MDFIQIKIEKDRSIAKYIRIIRKFDHSLPIGTIKQRIDENDFVMGFDLECYDVSEDIDGNEDVERTFRVNQTRRKTIWQPHKLRYFGLDNTSLRKVWGRQSGTPVFPGRKSLSSKSCIRTHLTIRKLLSKRRWRSWT